MFLTAAGYRISVGTTFRIIHDIIHARYRDKKASTSILSSYC